MNESRFKVTKNSTPSLTQKQAVALLEAIPTDAARSAGRLGLFNSMMGRPQREPGFGSWSFRTDSSQSGRWSCAPRESGVRRSSPTRHARYRSTPGEPS